MKVYKAGFALSIFLSVGQAAFAQSIQADSQFSDLRKELQELREMQTDIATRIARVESRLNTVSPINHNPAFAAEQISLLDKPPRSAAIPVEQKKQEGKKASISGDLRLRYEANYKNDDLPFRGREVIRGRLRANYAVNEHNTIGAGLATGSPDDPNTADVTLSNFTDDLAVSLDQLYWRHQTESLTVNAGKFANPFRRTDLVWDGDVNPQGLSAAYGVKASDAAKLTAKSMYYVIEESVLGSESDMLGFQASLEFTPNTDWKYDLSAAYYDYSLKSTAGADLGDFRTNLLALDGSYLSDFNLVDIIAALKFNGLGQRWPLALTANYVKNLKAATEDDTGYSLDVLFGRVSTPGEYRFGYGYAQAETDAVLAAFSHDNTNLATNYRQHTLTFDYAAADHIVFNAAYYHYRPLHTDFGPKRDWQDRLRLNLIFTY